MSPEGTVHEETRLAQRGPRHELRGPPADGATHQGRSEREKDGGSPVV